MPRKRKLTSDAWLPNRVYRGRSAFEWKTPDGKTVRLCHLRATPQQVIMAHHEAISRVPADNTIEWLAAEYFAGERFSEKALASQIDYRQALKMILKVFKAVPPNSVAPATIRKYMDMRGKTSRYRANRELSLLTVIFAHGFERGYVTSNPCKGVAKFTEKARINYVEPDAYRAVLDSAPLPVRVAMELAYTTGMRRSDVLSARWSDITPKGLLVKQNKTGVSLYKDITPRLRAALELAKRLPKPKGIASVYIVHNKSGAQYTGSGFSVVFRRAVAAAGQAFTFHDIRRTAITDFDGVKKDFSGHKTEAMAARYNVKPIKSPSH